MTFAFAFTCAFAVACGGTDIIEEHQSPAQRGRSLFTTRAQGASPSRDNWFSCSTCHSSRGTDSRILSGAVMGGATARPRYWGGSMLDLLSAINTCRSSFMGAGDPWSAADPDAQAMYAFLKSLPEVAPDAVPFTIVRTIANVPVGDATRGRDVYERACQTCHGLVHSGEGRLAESIPRLPDDTLSEHPTSKGYSPESVRLVVIEKIRHGGFLGYGGRMPLYSTEVLDDPKVGDVLAYLGF